MIKAMRAIIKSEDLLEQVYAKDFCSFKLGGKFEYLVTPKSLDDFCTYLQRLDGNSIEYKVLGNMSNILPSDSTNKGVFVTTKFMRDKPQFFGDYVTAYCGYPLSALSQICANMGLGGMECLSGIPASIGGAIFNNAGAFGQTISDQIESILIYSGGKIVSVDKQYAKFGYRKSIFSDSGEIILSATFRLKKQSPQTLLKTIEQTNNLRHIMQPCLPSAGSVFRKIGDQGAGKYIEQCGLKGKQIGRAQISDVHANFIVNLGGATSGDVKTLINLAEQAVNKKFNISLEREIEYIGEQNDDKSRLSHT